MTDFGLTEELAELRETVRRFAVDRVAPVIGDYYERHEFPYELIKQMGAMGLFGLPFPSEYGGMDGDYLALCVALEELARVDSSVAITLEAAISLGAMPVYRFGNEEQKRRWLPALTAGENVAAFGLTEVTSGSDAGNIRTTATLDEATNEWVINGGKAFITNSGTSITSLVTVTALTGPDEVSTIIVPSGTPGFTVHPGYSKVGWCASDTHELTFDNCRVPFENLLGERGRGFAQFLSILDEGRVAIAALAAGLAQGCVDESLKYAQQREAFGQAISGYQAISFKIADMEARGAHREAGMARCGGSVDRGRGLQAAGRDREAAREHGRGRQRPRRHAGPRRLRFHERISGGPHVARQQDPRDRRRDLGDSAHGDSPRPGPSLIGDTRGFGSFRRC
jgi:alkylation response protein AidB-like acyl-CoA dehydrogenase